MRFFDDLKEKARELSDSLQTSVKQFKNDAFAEGAMATCAMIAAADGTIDADERRKTAGLIMSNSVLQVFEASKLQTRFNFYCDKLSADYDFGKIEAIQAISKLRKKPDQARAIVQIGIVIGGADGSFDADEKAAVREICNAVGIPPAEFDL